MSNLEVKCQTEANGPFSCFSSNFSPAVYSTHVTCDCSDAAGLLLAQ